MDRSLAQAKPRRSCDIAQPAPGRTNEAMTRHAPVAANRFLPGPMRRLRASVALANRPCYRADPLPRRPGGTEQRGMLFCLGNP